MGGDMQAKLKLALGSVKDQASIGKAMMFYNNNNNQDRFSTSDIEIAVIRATGHGSVPVEDKHLHEILFLVSDSPCSVSFLADRVSRRLEKTRDLTVALKTLLLVHRLLRGGTHGFEEQLCGAFLSGHLQLGAARGGTRGFDPLVCFLQSYTAYLEERMSWVMNPSGKLEPANFMAREDSVAILFRRISKCQILVEKVLDFSLSVSPLNKSDLVHAAMANALKESFQVYEMLRESTAALMDSLFDLGIRVSSLVCEVLKKASIQIKRLHDFYEDCKVVVGTKNLEYPSVQFIDVGHVEELEQCLSNTVLSKPPPEYQTEPGDEPKKHMACSPINDAPFPSRLETKISNVWVVFDDEDLITS